MHFYPKTAIIVLLACLPSLADAQPVTVPAEIQDRIKTMQVMDPAERQDAMREMRERMVKLQACLGNEKQQAGLQEISTRAENLQARLKLLCKRGKAAEANSLARVEGQKIANDPYVKQMQDCLEEAQDKAAIASAVEAANKKDFDICKQE